jgi:hypothetical protein
MNLAGPNFNRIKPRQSFFLIGGNMNRIFPLFLVFALLVLGLRASPAFAYGSGGGGAASCAEAQFYDEQPARNSTVAAVSEIRLVASDNTEISSLDIKVNGLPVKPEVAQRRSGEWDLTLRLAAPITQPGKVRVTVGASSKEGCATFLPYSVTVGQ